MSYLPGELSQLFTKRIEHLASVDLHTRFWLDECEKAAHAIAKAGHIGDYEGYKVAAGQFMLAQRRFIQEKNKL